MAEVKGLRIELSADTSKLESGIKSVSTALKQTESELRAVDKSLKFNPGNTTLLKQKFDLLKKSVSQTEAKLADLKAKQAKMDASGVDKNSKEYRELEREIIKTGNQLDRAKKKLSDFGSVGKQKLLAVGQGFKNAGDKLTSAGQAMSGFSRACAVALAAVGALVVKSGLWADDLNTMSKVYHISTGELQKYSIAADLVDVSLETIAKSHTKLEKTMISATEGNKKSAKAFKQLGIDVKDSNGNFRDTDEVFQEAIEALGGIEDETKRDALAMKLFGKSANELNPLIEDCGETYKNVSDTMKKYGLEPVSQETLDNANAFNDSIDMMKAIGLTAFQMVGTKLAGYLAPALEKVVDLVGKLAKWFTSLSPRTQMIIAGFLAVGAAIAPLLIGLGKIAFAINALITLGTTIGPLIGGGFAAIAGPVGLVVVAVAAAIAAGVLLYKNWDKVKKILTTALNAMKQKFSAVFNAIKAVIVKFKQNAIKIFTAVRAKLVWLKDRFVGFRTAIGTVMTAVKTVLQNFATKAAKVFLAIRAKLVWLKDRFVGFKDALKTIFGKVKEKVQSLYQKFANFKSAVAKVIGKVEGIIDGFKGSAGEIFAEVKEKIGDLQSGFSTFKDKCSKIFETAKGYITKPLGEAKSTVSDIIDSITDKFDSFKDKVTKPFKFLAGLRLPKVTVNGGKAPWGIGGKGEKPSFNVDWNAKAMQFGRILKGAQIFGMQGDKLLGGGEIGREVVAGANTLSGLITAAVMRGMHNSAGVLAQAVGTSTALAAGGGQDVVVNVYMYKNGPQMGREIVHTYDTWKAKLG